MRPRSSLSLIVALLFLSIIPASAAELKIFGVAPVRTTINALTATYKQSTGNEATATVVASDIVEKSLEGKTFDVMVLSTPEMDEQEKLGRIQAGSRVKLARVGIGVAMREGAPKPDLSTPEKFKEAMLAAKSIAYRRINESHLSGALAERILTSAGIIDTLRPKIKIMNLSASKAGIAKGEIEYGFYNISEATGPAGVVLAGPVPPPLQLYSTFEAALTKEPAAVEEAKGFLTYIAGAKPVWEKAGFEMLR